MEEGSLRCDANISVREKGLNSFGVKTEIKNMNSFKSVRKALSFEAERQISLLNKGEKILQETRLWNENLGITEEMRSKEEAHDYRYFPEPDLVPLKIDKELIEKIKSQIGELPEEKLNRFKNQYNLSHYDASVLTLKKEIADYFETCLSYLSNPKILANWIMGDLMALTKEKKIKFDENPVTPKLLTELVKLVIDGKITGTIGKEILKEVFNTGKTPSEIIKEKNLVQIQDEDSLIRIVKEVLEENPKAISDYKEGKTQAIGFLIGKVMQKTKGKANPNKTQEIIIKYIKE